VENLLKLKQTTINFAALVLEIKNLRGIDNIKKRSQYLDSSQSLTEANQSHKWKK
jgi:hypothetical protein